MLYLGTLTILRTAHKKKEKKEKKNSLKAEEGF